MNYSITKTGLARGILILRRHFCDSTFLSSHRRKKMTEEDIVAGSELDKTLKKWEEIQIDLKDQVILHDTQQWQKTRSIATSYDTVNLSDGMLQYVAGMDISALKDKSTACVALVICKLPTLRVVYKDFEIVDLKSPYVAGYLSFRESEFLIKKYQELKSLDIPFEPQVLLIDGNGVLHARECGLACHVGVTLDVPTVGVAKNLFHVKGIVRDKERMNSMVFKGDTCPLIDDSGQTLGVALKTSAAADNPVFVSVGHKISLETAAWLVTKCSLYRIPEPTRQADILSREYLRMKFPEVAGEHGNS